MAIDVAWTAITDGQVDADSPLNQILMQAIKDDLYHLELWLGKSYTAANDHDHNGTNSAQVVLADYQVTEIKLATNSISQAKMQDASIGQAELKASYVEVSVFMNTPATLYRTSNVATSDYSFQAMLKIGSWDAGVQIDFQGWDHLDLRGTYIGAKAKFYTTTLGSAKTGYAKSMYITASGEVFWIYHLVQKGETKPIRSYSAPDHPRMVLKTNMPFDDYDPERHDIVVINPNQQLIREIENIYGQGNILQAVHEEFGIERHKEPSWPDVPVTIGVDVSYDDVLVDDSGQRIEMDRAGKPVRPGIIKSVKKYSVIKEAVPMPPGIITADLI